MIKETLVKNIKKAVKSTGLTQKEFCEKVDINYYLFNQYMAVKNRKIPSEWLPKIAVGVGVTTDSLYGIEEL